MSNRAINVMRKPGTKTVARRNRAPKLGGRLSLIGTDIDRFSKPKIMRSPMPDSIYVTLRFELFTFIVNAGQVFASDYLLMNNAWNPLHVASVATVPFGEYAAFFNYYRVINFRSTSTFSNLENFSAMCIVVPSTTTLGTNNSLIEAYSTNQHASKKLISAKTGADRCVLRTKICLPAYYGVTEYMNNPALAGSVTGTGPTTPLYFNWGIVTTSNQASGVEYLHTVELDTIFYRKDMFSS
jgi:hypothetical protein